VTGKRHPELHRVANAALVAAFAAIGSLTAAGLVLLAASPRSVGGIGEILVFAFFLGVPLAALHALGLGLPLYLLLRRRWALTPARAALGGFAVATVPWLLLALGSGAPALEAAGALGFAGLPGAIGGLVFWSLLRGGP
jgi:hypothetical protein